MKDYDTLEAARALSDIFDKHADWNGRIREQGLQDMRDLFGDIPIEERGNVFVAYITMLEEEGYVYDVKQFGDTKRPIDPLDIVIEALRKVSLDMRGGGYCDDVEYTVAVALDNVAEEIGQIREEYGDSE